MLGAQPQQTGLGSGQFNLRSASHPHPKPIKANSAKITKSCRFIGGSFGPLATEAAARAAAEGQSLQTLHGSGSSSNKSGLSWAPRGTCPAPNFSARPASEVGQVSRWGLLNVCPSPHRREVGCARNPPGNGLAGWCRFQGGD